MSFKRWLPAVAMVALAVGASGVACDQPVREATGGKPPTPAAPTQPAAEVDPAIPAADPVPATAPETKPAEPQPVLSFITINGLGTQFPLTKLLVHTDGGKLRAELFSDLPKSALAHYEGNELYLEMDLDGAVEAGKVDGAFWRYKSMSSEKADSPNGIFLNGQRQHLQPADVLVKFERNDDKQLTAQITGQFRAYEPGTPDALAPFVGVRGTVPVEIVEKR